jgi:hypothetical protein
LLYLLSYELVQGRSNQITTETASLLP